MNRSNEVSILSIFGLIGILFGVIIAGVLVFGSWVTIEAGHAGVLLRMGAVTGKILPPGFSMKVPWADTVAIMNVQVQKDQIDIEAASKDLQTTHTTIALNLRPHPEKITEIYQKIGMKYMDTIVSPAMQESAKAVISQYTAEELVIKREIVRENIKSLLATKLSNHGFIVDDMNIINFNFSQSFNASIELKVTAEQNALAAKNKLSQIEFEALQKVAEAKGKAEAMTIESKAIASNPQILQLRALEKWNGELPKMMGSGVVPFVQFPTEK